LRGDLPHFVHRLELRTTIHSVLRRPALACEHLPAVLLVLLVLAVRVCAADPPAAVAADPSAVAADSAAKTQAPAPPGKAKPAAGSAPKKTKSATATEFEISAYTSEIADQMNGRVNLSRTNSTNRSWLRTGYGLSRSRTFSKSKVNETELRTLNVDAGFRRGGRKSYRFVQAVANVRTRRPSHKGYPGRSGYRMLSAGVGTSVSPVLDLEVALASVNRINRQGATEHMVTPVYTFALKAPVTSSATLDGDLRLVKPFTDDPLVDLRLNLTYKLTPALSLRLTYLANNLLNNLLIPVSSRPETEWDKSFRISLVFGRAPR